MGRYAGQRARAVRGTAAATALLLCSCGAATIQGDSSAALATGATVKSLAAGHLDSLPTGTEYVQVTAFAQPAGTLIGSKKHVPGIIMQEHGSQRLAVEGSPPLDIHAGEAAFLPSVFHTHVNPGPDANNWINFALWPSSAREAPLTSATATVAFATPDLPAGALPRGPFAITLQMVTLQPHGRTEAHTYGGVNVVFVLQGSINAHADGRSPATLSVGDGSWALAGKGLQEIDDGSQPATFLTFVILGLGKPFETALNRAP